MIRVSLLASCLLMVLEAPSTAAEIVVNGGFETGDLTDWSFRGPIAVGDVSTAHTGLHGATLAGPLSFLSQQIRLQPYTYYDVSVWLKIPVAPEPIPEFVVGLGQMNVIFEYNNPGPFDYLNFVSPHVYVTASKVLLSITRAGVGGLWDLDDISVIGEPYTPVPEPATWALMATALGLVGTSMRTFHRSRKRTTCGGSLRGGVGIFGGPVRRQSRSGVGYG